MSSFGEPIAGASNVPYYQLAEVPTQMLRAFLGIPPRRALLQVKLMSPGREIRLPFYIKTAWVSTMPFFFFFMPVLMYAFYTQVYLLLPLRTASEVPENAFKI